MKIPGFFLLLGEAIEPQVRFVDAYGMAAFNDRLRIASKYDSEKVRHEAYRLTFKCAAQFAIPCWNDEAMTQLATHYTGPHEKRVRGLAACIVTGTPYGGTSNYNNGGGQPALIDPVKPLPRKPGGAKVKAPRRQVEVL